MKLKRTLTEDEQQIAFKKLEEKVKIIQDEHADYFKIKDNPKSIEYMLASGRTDWSGLIVYNVPFIVFLNQNLNEEIKDEVRKSFIDIVNDIINSK
jgi:hypothetical protein